MRYLLLLLAVGAGMGFGQTDSGKGEFDCANTPGCFANVVAGHMACTVDKRCWMFNGDEWVKLSTPGQHGKEIGKSGGGGSGLAKNTIPGGEIKYYTNKPEPIDVPAIQKKHKACVQRKDEGFACFGGIADGPCGCGWYEDNVDYWTCGDSKRILEHTEEVPPKYTCRKVQE
jgi:hypothetical protein